MDPSDNSRPFMDYKVVVDLKMCFERIDHKAEVIENEKWLQTVIARTISCFGNMIGLRP
jgi:hypothetical protein